LQILKYLSTKIAEEAR